MRSAAEHALGQSAETHELCEQVAGFVPGDERIEVTRERQDDVVLAVGLCGRSNVEANLNDLPIAHVLHGGRHRSVGIGHTHGAEAVSGERSKNRIFPVPCQDQHRVAVDAESRRTDSHKGPARTRRQIMPKGEQPAAAIHHIEHIPIISIPGAPLLRDFWVDSAAVEAAAGETDRNRSIQAHSHVAVATLIGLDLILLAEAGDRPSHVRRVRRLHAILQVVVQRVVDQTDARHRHQQRLMLRHYTVAVEIAIHTVEDTGEPVRVVGIDLPAHERDFTPVLRDAVPVYAARLAGDSTHAVQAPALSARNGVDKNHVVIHRPVAVIVDAVGRHALRMDRQRLLDVFHTHATTIEDPLPTRARARQLRQIAEESLVDQPVTVVVETVLHLFSLRRTRGGARRSRAGSGRIPLPVGGQRDTAVPRRLCGVAVLVRGAGRVGLTAATGHLRVSAGTAGGQHHAAMTTAGTAGVATSAAGTTRATMARIVHVARTAGVATRAAVSVRTVRTALDSRIVRFSERVGLRAAAEPEERHQKTHHSKAVELDTHGTLQIWVKHPVGSAFFKSGNVVKRSGNDRKQGKKST